MNVREGLIAGTSTFEISLRGPPYATCVVSMNKGGEMGRKMNKDNTNPVVKEIKYLKQK